jgi:hypothetical protein
VEILLISGGHFVHLRPDVLGVAAGLAFLTPVASVPLCALARRLVDR